MEIFSIIFGLTLALTALAVVVGIAFVLGPLSALALAAGLVALYLAANYRSGAVGPASRKTLNAFQQPLADD